MSKREVKKIEGLEKELLSESERVELWISKNWIKTAVAALVVVAIGVAVYAFIQNKDKQSEKLRNQFLTVEIASLPALIAANSDAPGVDLARMRLANELNSKADFAAAAAEFKKIADNPEADIQLRQLAALECGSALENSKNIAAAAAAFSSAADESAFSDGIRAQAAFQAARLMIAGKNKAEAKAILQRTIARKIAVNDDMFFMIWCQQCEQMKTALENGDFDTAPAKTAKAAEKVAAKAPVKK